MARAKMVAGNWKMYPTTAAAARTLAAGVVKGAGDVNGVQLVICPPYPWLGLVSEIVQGSPVSLGAQNLYHRVEGAYTGEVSGPMLHDIGCRYVIVGHSERRHVMHESDQLINHKVRAALAAGLEVILCVGETLAERQADETHRVLDWHFTTGLAHVKQTDLDRLTIAYEPVWAIGTGINATPEQAQEVHAFLRKRYADLFGPAMADRVKILYGGSVKPDNAATLIGQPDVDGALVGGASLKADTFLAIAKAAKG
jgi:triosephosphate isomerase